MAYKQLQRLTTNRDDGEWPTSQSCHCHAASSVASSVIQTDDSRLYMDEFSGNT